MADNHVKLFTEFPPVSTQKWVDKIKTDLKGADYDRKLVWKTNEGLNVQPFYRNEDLEEINYLEQLPGNFPFVRGSKISNDWYIRQNIDVKNVKEANKKALDILMKGVNSIGFSFEKGKKVTEAELEVLLNEIVLESVELNFEPAHSSKEIISFLKIKTKNVTGSLNYDPIGKFAITGAFCESYEKSIEFAKDLVESAKEFQNFKTIGVNGRNFNNAGSSIVQELAFSLSIGADYLTELTEKGLSADDVASQIKFNFGIGSNYFMEIAKIRAARLLWAKIVGAFNPVNMESASLNIHAETSLWNKTVYDPYVNMLRSQTETMSGSLAGVDSFTVQPFNAAYENPTEFSERIARNQQILLKEEAYFDKVADPSAGSYYIEKLTDSIAEQAWRLFLEIDEKGGFVKALEEGFIQNLIQEIVDKRNKNIENRKEVFLGTNQFPNFNEQLENINLEILQESNLKAENATIEPIKLYRGSQKFEQLRFKTDHSEKRPKAFMLTIGNNAMRKARSQFACNFFAIAGFEVVDNNGFETVEEGINTALKEKSDIIVICSSDEEYAELTPKAFEHLKGQAIFVVAGAPACADDLKAKGISNFINVKSNVLEELSRYQQELGIK